MTDKTRSDPEGARRCGRGAVTVAPAAAQRRRSNTPQAGAKLKLMRWRRFIQSDEDQWNVNTARFTSLYRRRGDDLNGASRMCGRNWRSRPTWAAGRTSRSGGWRIHASSPTSWWSLATSPNTWDRNHGGWYDARRGATARLNSGPNKGKWIGLPLGAGGALLNYRISWMKEAGFETFPTDYDAYLKMLPRAGQNGHHARLRALSHATGDAETWSHNVLWGFGGKVTRRKNKRVINSPGDGRCHQYMIELNKTFIEGTLSWTGVSNNNAFLEGRISLTSNGPSIYYVARIPPMRSKAIAADMNHSAYPIGPSGQTAELHLLSQAMLFKYTEVSQRGQGLPAVHVGEGAVRAVAGGGAGAMCPAQGLCSDAVLEGRSQADPIPRRVGAHALERLCRRHRRGLCRLPGRLGRGGHVRAGGQWAKVAEGSGARSGKRAKRHYRG